MREIDWAGTPLGPISQWPQSLRTTLSMVSESKFGMYVAWGPDYIQFYNDGYRPILGSTKHPAFGRSSRETFKESWHIIGPLFEQVRRGEAVGSEDWMLPLDRNGYLEECFFTFSYSPIRDESGGVGGVLVTVAETTPHVLSGRRMSVLRELAARAAEAKTAEQAWSDASVVLAGSAADLPFVALYELDPEGSRADRVGLCHLPSDTALAPETFRLDDGEGPLAIVGEAVRTRAVRVIDGVRATFGELFGSLWPEPVDRVVVLPISRPSVARPYGALLVGVSPRRALDDQYRLFLDLIAEHVATGVGNARAHQEERRRTEALAELDRAKTTFFSNVSHELRTPLSLMLGPLEELCSGRSGALSAEQRAELGLIHRNGLRLLKLVNNLLDFARIEAGRADAVFEPCELASATAEIASVFRSAIERAGLSFTVECPLLEAPVFVDRDMWEKIVLNLLSNALKFTFEGGISVRLTDREGGVVLQVSDTGAGVPAIELPNLFTRFHRIVGTPSRSHEGSGIGLALVAELVRIHGGTIAVDSPEGAGTTFTVTLRRGSEHLPKAHVREAGGKAPSVSRGRLFVDEARRWLPDAETPSQDVVPAAQRSSERIMVVDDNADMRSYLTRLLSPRWEVEAVPDGFAALESARVRPPDLILTDVMMPRIDGYHLLRALRADPVTRAIPAIVLSARTGDESQIEALDVGAYDYLTKPFSSRELIARVSAQLELSRMHRAVDGRRAELYQLFMQAPAPICVLRGESLIFEMANPLYERMVQRSALVGMTLAEALPTACEQGFDALLRRVMATGEPAYGEEKLLHVDRRGEGVVEDTYFNFVYAPLRSEGGASDRAMVFCIDVTDQVMARRQAEAASRAKDEFLAMLGHELRNPLSPIVTAVALMKQRDPDIHFRERMVIERQTQHMIRLVDDLLDVSRITRGKIQLHKQQLELYDVVASAIETVSPLLEERRHQLELDVPRTGLRVFGDPIRLAQIVANLVTNAAKYTSPGGRIEVRASAQDGEAELRVRDNGVGIASHLLPKVFDLFVQGDDRPSHGIGGLGLGLALVRSLTNLHGGTVTAYSEGPGHGSEMVVRMPLIARAHKVGRVYASPSVGKSRTRHRVLVVDDNQDAAQLLAEALRALGHEALVAFDGPSAISSAEAFQPEVVLLDIGLPLMDGYEVARRLRELHPDRGLRLIAVTGYGSLRDQQRAAAAGFDRHMIKPIDLEELTSALD